MITPSQIVTHLGRYLPRLTGLFNDTLSASASVSGSTLTVTTTTAHGLSAGSNITISAARVIVPIVGAVVNGDNIIFETSVDHDLTEPRQVNDMGQITLAGFTDAEWNTAHELLAVPNRLNFEVAIPDVVGLTLNGNETLRVERSVSVLGIVQVASVIDTTSFTVTIPSSVPSLDTLSLDDLSVVTSVRVVGVSTLERAEEIYTKRGANKLWCFVMMTDTDISKDRHSINDGTASFSMQDEMRLRNLNHFSTIVYMPSSDSLAGASRQELAYGDVYTALLGCLYGYTGFNSIESGTKFAVVAGGHGPGKYTPAYYTHVYDWELPQDVTADNGFSYYESVAFRDMYMSLPMNTVDNAERYTLAINLDDEPISGD